MYGTNTTEECAVCGSVSKYKNKLYDVPMHLNRHECMPDAVVCRKCVREIGRLDVVLTLREANDAAREQELADENR